MANSQIIFSESGPITLTSIQRQVVDILNTTNSSKYPLAEWYLGAIYAAKNIYNPDRYSQAAQSLRELLEKLPRLFIETGVQLSRPNFQDMRSSLYSQLLSAKKRYGGEWNEKAIDVKLEKFILGIESYFELNKTPTRKDQIHYLMRKLDPMHDALDQGIRLEKSDQFRRLWKTLEDLAHHKTIPDDKLFWEQLAIVERLIVDLLAPITAQDQVAIRTIISKPHLEQNDVVELIELVKRRGANYVFFFNAVNSPEWIAPLVENGIFKNPPNVEFGGDDRVAFPFWWPILFLQRVSAQSPAQVVDIILGMEETNNPLILREICSIACGLSDVDLSLRLKPLVKQFLKSPYQFCEEDLVAKILNKWGNKIGPSRVAAREIVQYVIAFQPDPREKEKRSRRKENPEAWNTLLEPSPRFNQWEYQQILEKGVRPLVEHEPYQMACILIDATSRMIKMKMHKENPDKDDGEDLSEFWCRRLDKSDHEHQDSDEALVHTLTYACEEVYNKDPGFIDLLDQKLRKQRWKIFIRLRQYLYSAHLDSRTLPWVRELILNHSDYSKWKHHYESQIMIRKACEHFGHQLLDESEMSGIFNEIISGPHEEIYQKNMGVDFSKESFEQCKRNFHYLQLYPFAALLGGEYKIYFDGLECEAQEKIVTDESYSPYSGVRSGAVSYRSPKSAEELGRFTDDELLFYLNDWSDEHRDKDNWLVEINIPALAGVFQSIFKDMIVPDGERLDFWIANRDNIARPIYVEAMVKVMQEFIKNKNIAKLDKWIEFCAWILSHPDSKQMEGQHEARDKTSVNPDWSSSRRAVVDFIDACVEKDTNIPITAREGLSCLLQEVCSQGDWRLDQDHPVLLNDDPIVEAINNTRSRGLESLVNLGFWILRHLPDDPVPELKTILSKRLGGDAELLLTRPERALLGMHFGNLCALDLDWAIDQRGNIFSQGNKNVWLDAFGSYIRYNNPSAKMFEILRQEFEYALENLNVLTSFYAEADELVENLGHHLFEYYLWQLYPLTGEKSLLEIFYNKTTGDRKHWAKTFGNVGYVLRNSGNILEKELTDRVIAYFDWRLEAAEMLELQEFACWLDAECLNSEWRLRSYAKILDLGFVKSKRFSFEMEALSKLHSEHLGLVIECFAKITDLMVRGAQMHIPTDKVKPILKAGLNAGDPLIRGVAEHARENCLRLGRFEFLDIE